jgi:hypothetical protein
MVTDRKVGKQNVTVGLDRATIEKAKIIAARSGTSISELVAQGIEAIFGEEDSCESSERHARKLFERGFHLGGGVRVGRDALHERKRRGG